MGLRRVFASFEDGSVSCFPTAASCFVCTKSTFNKGQTSKRARRPEQRSRQWDQWRNEQAGSEQRDQKTVDCPPGSDINGTCDGTHCVVRCGNGKKVEMECPEEAIKVSGGTATCGKKLEFPPCFPFCG